MKGGESLTLTPSAPTIKSASITEPSSNVTVVLVVFTSATRLESLRITGFPLPSGDVAILFSSW